MTTQYDLLGFPITAPDVAPPVATYQRYETKNAHHVCARCLLACHIAEKHNCPPPPTRSVAWRRQCGDTVELLCYRHKAEAHAEDRAAGRLAKPEPGRRTTRVTA